MFEDAIGRACGSRVVAARPVAGGSINDALRVTLEDGRDLFVKHRRDLPAGFYAAEAAALRWLAEADALAVPSPVAWSEAFLVLGWLQEGRRAPGFDAALGHGLALLHAAGAARHGATADDGPTFIGPLRVGNEPAGDSSWAAFYGERRLAPLLRMATDAGALPSGCAERVGRVIGRLDELCGPAEPPARLHGDLWSGNVMAGPHGAPVVVDPAAYGGHREIDLAMLRLFGSPGAEFLAAYQDAGPPLADGFEERVELNQLLPLLVHAVLFGGGYGAAADRAARRYA